MAGYGYTYNIYMHPPAQDTNTNDATNGLTFCVFYDTQTNGMCVSMCWTLCLRFVCSHDMSMCCSVYPVLYSVHSLTVTLLCALLQTGPLRVVK